MSEKQIFADEETGSWDQLVKDLEILLELSTSCAEDMIVDGVLKEEKIKKDVKDKGWIDLSKI